MRRRAFPSLPGTAGGTLPGRSLPRWCWNGTAPQTPSCSLHGCALRARPCTASAKQTALLPWERFCCILEFTEARRINCTAGRSPSVHGSSTLATAPKPKSGHRSPPHRGFCADAGQSGQMLPLWPPGLKKSATANIWRIFVIPRKFCPVSCFDSPQALSLRLFCFPYRKDRSIP